MQTTDRKMTLGEIATQFLVKVAGTQKDMDQQEINKFVRWYGADRSLETIIYHDVEKYLERFGPGLTKGAEVLKPLKDFFSYAKEEGYNTTDLGKIIRLRKQRAAEIGLSKRQVQEQETMTKEGFEHLKSEIDSLKGERGNIAQMLNLAMADKDFKENAPLDAAREHQGMVESKIRDLEAVLRRAEVADSNSRGDGSRVMVGSTLLITDMATNEEMKYTIVHPNEANLAVGKLSGASPIGKSLLGHSVSDVVDITTPSGVLKYRIGSIG